MKRIEEKKVKLELYVADVVDDHKIKMDAMRLKIKKIRKYVINKEAWYHYAVGSYLLLHLNDLDSCMLLYEKYV